jgi:hypothetical protein
VSAEPRKLGQRDERRSDQHKHLPGEARQRQQQHRAERIQHQDIAVPDEKQVHRAQ